MSTRFKGLPTASSMARGAGAAEEGRHPDQASGQPGAGPQHSGIRIRPQSSPELNASPRQARWREGRGQRREERGWQAPGPGLGAARGSMRASGRASAASYSRHLAQLREGRLTQHLILSTAGICLAGAPLVFTDAESTAVGIPETFFAGAMRRVKPPSAIRVSD